MNFSIEKRSVILAFGAVLLVALGLRAFFIWTSITHLPVTGDEALIVLIAKQVIKGEWPLLISGTPYLFPIEGYFMAPLVEWMPRNTIGARYLTMSLGLLSLVGFFYLTKKVLPKDSQWPTFLLVLFPSAYLLILQSGYVPPNYAASITFAWITPYLLAMSFNSSRRYLLFLLIGIVSGIAFSTHMLTISYIFPAFILILLGKNLVDAAKGAGRFLFGALIGLAPFILSIVHHPHAHEAVSKTRPILEVIHRLWDPALSQTLPGAMGVNPTLFPDFSTHLNQIPLFRDVFAVIYSSLILAVFFHRLVLFIRHVKQGHWPYLDIQDYFLASSLIAIVLYAFSERASSESYRYLVVPVIFFPFLLGYTFSITGKKLRCVVGAIAVGLGLFNFVTSVEVTRAWRTPQFAGQIAKTPGIIPLIEELKKKGIDRCYASFWLGYRIIFRTDEEIICAPPYNERFLGWPIPYKDTVDKSPGARYILTHGYDTRLPIIAFERHMKEQNISYSKWNVGPFYIYEDFHHKQADVDTKIVSQAYLLNSSTQGSGLEYLSDNNERSSWSSNSEQKMGMWLQAKFNTQRTVQRVTLVYPFIYPHLPDETAKSIKILGRRGGSWIVVADNIMHHFDRTRFKEKHPVYGGMHQTFWFDPIRINAIKVEIVIPRKGKLWKMSQLEFGTPCKGTTVC
ncbi:MAG TPA: hypothetical protein ENI80_10035 [Acidiferrobacteraceae bacterium]|nr:hypothetical protein [Acidiferrobacteraceae bacterium]